MEPGTFWTAFVWAVIPALILLGAIWWLDRYEKELGGNNTPSLYTSMITGLNHVFYGAVIGLALAVARKNNMQVIGGALVAGIGFAFLFHVLHDYLPWWAASSASSPESSFGSKLITQIPSYLGVFVLGLVALWTIGREKVIVAQELNDEVKSGVVTADDYANVTNSFRRSQTLTTALLSRGQWVWRLRRKLYGLEAKLAFRKYHRREETSAQSRAFQSEEAYRAQIRETRQELAEVDPGSVSTKRGDPRAPSNRFVAGLGGRARS